MIKFSYLLPFFCWLSLTKSANILGVFPIHVKSHVVMFESLMKALAEKGHNVDIVTQFPSKYKPPRYNEISLDGTLPPVTNNIPVNLVSEFSHYGMIEFMTRFAGVDICGTILKTETMQKLRKTQKKYDLVVTEIFGSDCWLGFGYIFKAPIISMISSTMLPWGNDRVGNPDNPSYIPTYFVPASAKMDLYDRIKNTIFLVSSKWLYNFFSSKDSNKIAKEYFGPDLPALEYLALNTSLILVNSHFSISYSRPTMPNFIEVGGLHIKNPKPLPKHLEDILKSDKNGVIYFTMGSMVLTETFDPDKLQGMFDAFAQLPYKVLWKATREKFPKSLKIPENIYFEKWMPQFDVLCHPNIKLFITHGGLLGFQEAVYCGIPVLGIPLFADQVFNIKAAERMGLGLKLDYKNINKETMFGALEELLKNSSYKQNSEKVSKEFKDRPLSPLETAIYWTEYVIRHNGAPHLRSPGADLNWYQYYLIDVGLILSCGFLIIVYLFFQLLRIILKVVNGSNKRKTD